MGNATGRRSARMTITMPPELKREMGAVPESVNWSAVAAETFRRVLRGDQPRGGSKQGNREGGDCRE